jgi:uncharacterized membrane protein YhfC
MLLSVVVPFGLLIFMLVRCLAHFKSGIKPILVGAGMFFLFALVLEQILHFFILKQNPATAAFFTNHLAYAVYGGLAAGIFEETGRLVGFRLLLKKPGRWEQGLAYGMGHGGFEVIYLGGMNAVSQINNLYYSILINSDKFGQLLKASQGIPLQLSNLETIRQQLTGTPSWEFLMGGIERVFALAIQLALSLLILYAVAKRRYIFYILAILLHAIVDFTSSYMSLEGVPLLIVESVIALYAVLALIFILLTKKKFYIRQAAAFESSNAPAKL